MSSITMAMPITKSLQPPTSDAFFKPLPVRSSKPMFSNSYSKSKLHIQASLKEKAVAGLTAAALTASMVIPEVALAAGNDLVPSLKNFLLSIGAGGVVLTAILAAIIGVSNFDPVKRT